MRKILTLFTDFIVEKGDFTVEGVEAAHQDFINSLEIRKHAAKRVVPDNANSASYVKTTLEEAVAKAKLPIKIPVFKNKFGHWESTVCRGLIFSDTDPQHAIAIGDQGEDGKIHELSMNQLLVCQSNGWHYSKENTIGSAAECENQLST